MTTSDQPRAEHSVQSHGSVALWASAFLLAALIVVQAGRIGSSNEAQAGNVAEVGTMRILTAAAGGDEEIIVLLNSTEESLTVYGIENGRSVELYQIVNLPDVFLQRSAVPGGGAPGGRR